MMKDTETEYEYLQRVVVLCMSEEEGIAAVEGFSVFSKTCKSRSEFACHLMVAVVKTDDYILDVLALPDY